MDVNKLKVLKEVKYSVKQCCGICIYANIAPTSNWGTCTLNDYNHEKHSVTKRELSISRYGYCEFWKIHPEQEFQLGAYKEFLEEY